MKVKEIVFESKRGGNDYFDLVNLQSILKLKPKDHNQFDHHKVSFFVIIIITDQKGKHSINYKDYSYKKGTIFTIRQNSIHKLYHAKATGKFLIFTEEFVVRYSGKTESLKLFQLFNELLSSPKLQLNTEEFAEIANLLLQIEKEYLQTNDGHSIEIIRSLLQALIHKLFRIKSKKNNGLGNKKKYLQFSELHALVEQDCFESKKVKDYAAKMGVTPRTLNNITQGTIQKPAKKLIDEIIILQIKRLIINSNLSFTEVAYQAGFEDPTNFFKFFRKKTGLSPKQFKESCG